MADNFCYYGCVMMWYKLYTFIVCTYLLPIECSYVHVL